MGTGTDLVATESTEVVEATPVVSASQKRTAVYQHPQRAQIEAMLVRGKSAEWISLWLEDEYPTVERDDKGNELGPHPEARKHRRWQLRPKTIERYRSEYMPECVPGIDVIPSEIEDIIGRQPLPHPNDRPELARIELAQQVGVHNLQRALSADKKMGFLQPSTLAANEQVASLAKEAVEVKSKLGVPGYEAVPERQEIKTTNTNRNLSVELHGRIGPDGKPIAGDPERVSLAHKMLAKSPEETAALVAAAKKEEAVQKHEADFIDATGATEIPNDKDLDGSDDPAGSD